MRSRKRDRLYQRAGGRWYADLRDLGGDREAMKPLGEKYATTERDVAASICAVRVREMEEGRRSRQLLGVRRRVSIGRFATEWIDYRSKSEIRARTIERYQLAFVHAFKVLDDSLDMDSVSLADVKQVLASLRSLKTRRGIGLASASVRQVIIAMSQLFDHADALGVIPAGQNPWKRLPKAERPKAKPSDTEFLEVREAAALLKASESIKTRTVPLKVLLSAFLLTGGRLNEVLGLEWSDIDFDRELVQFRANKWRPLKAGRSRVVRLWPQLRTELEAHRTRSGKIGGLVFPGSTAGGDEAKSWGKLYGHLTRCATLSGIAKRVTPQVLRVTYCAARLQTTDHGAPVAMWTVKSEMGHSSLSMIERVYGRLGTFRHRAEVVEYLLEGRALGGVPGAMLGSG